MASQTRAQIELQMNLAVLALEELRGYAETDATNLLAILDEHAQAVVSDYAPQALAGMDSLRGRIADALSVGQIRAILDPHIFTWGRFINSPEIDPQRIFLDLYEYFHENSLSVESRDFTFGSVTAGGSNVGTGTLHRLTVDPRAYDIEFCHAEAKTAECIRDEHSGAVEHAEVFIVKGEARHRDTLKIDGSGALVTLTALSGRDSRRFLQNPSFDVTSLSFSGDTVQAAAATDLTGWTITGTVTNVTLDRTTGNYYRDSLGESNPTAIRFTGNAVVTQNLNVRNAQFLAHIPYYIQIAYNREVGLGDGTLTLRLGSQTVSVVLSVQTGWNILKLPLDENLFYDNWRQEDPTVAITLSGYSTGYVLVDDVILAPMSQIDGTWYALVGGATPFLREDEFSWTDSEGGLAVLQRWLVRGEYGYLPHSGSPTWDDPPPTPTPTPSPTPTPTPRTPTPTPTPTP